MYAFDIETDGLLDELTKIHCINVVDRVSGKRLRFNDAGTGNGTVLDGVRLLHRKNIAAHNALGFDVPAIKKLYPWFSPATVLDTQVAAAVIWTDIRDRDFACVKSGRLPQEFVKKGLIGRHSLAAWGYRLGEYKGEFNPADFGHTWATIPFSQVMDDYCAQDVEVLVKLIELIESKRYSQQCLDLEHAFKEIIVRQEGRGVVFNVEAAEALTARLLEVRAGLEEEAASAFKPWYAPVGQMVPKRDNRTTGYVAGAPFTKIELRVFNPGSRDDIADRLQKVCGWEPTEFTKEGKPKVDEAVLSALPYVEAKVLSEYLLVQKRLGQIAEGKEAWLKAVRADGRIHGRVNTNGAVTGRCTHSSPNLAQVPRVGSPYGADCRALFMAAPGHVLIGCDADGLELRMLGHYLAPYDGGEFWRSVHEGRKEDGTDAHSRNQRVMGLNKRDSAKTGIYALLYGAGDYKLGTVVYDDFTDKQRDEFNRKYLVGTEERRAALTRLGKQLKARVMKGLKGYRELVEGVKSVSRQRGYLRGLDGRRLLVRSDHSALNTLLQSAGALVMKQALVICDQMLRDEGLSPGKDYEFVLNIHDEWQIETLEVNADIVRRVAPAAILAAGEHFKLACPTPGNADVGRTWAETH